MGTKTLMALSTPSSPRQKATSSWRKMLPRGHIYGTSSRTFLLKPCQVDWFSSAWPRRLCVGRDRQVLGKTLAVRHFGLLLSSRKYLSAVLHIPLIFVDQQHVRPAGQTRCLEAKEEEQAGGYVARQPKAKLYLWCKGSHHMMAEWELLYNPGS